MHDPFLHGSGDEAPKLTCFVYALRCIQVSGLLFSIGADGSLIENRTPGHKSHYLAG